MESAVIKRDKIIVGERFRKEYPKIEELAQSIINNGIVHPPSVSDNGDGTYTLVAGGRRIKAFDLLGFVDISVNIIGEITELKRRTLELEENLEREPMTATEEAEAVAELHRLKQLEYGEAHQGTYQSGQKGWTKQDTAEVIGKHPSTAGRTIELGETLLTLKQSSPKLYALVTEGGKAKSASSIEKTIKRMVKKQIRKDDAEQRLINNPSLANMVLHGDCIEMIKTLPSGVFDLVYTDPPFGVLEDSLRDSIASKRSSGGLSYYDDPLYIIKMLQQLAPELYRVMAQDSHLYMYCTLGAKDPKNPEGYASFQNIAKALSDTGFAVRPGPLIWCKDIPFGFVPDPNAQFPYCYEGIVFARKGSREFTKKPPRDFFLIPPMIREREHIAQKSPALHYEVMQYSAFEGAMMLDTFCGSGGSLCMGVELGMNVVGIDLDESCVHLSRSQLGEKLEERKSMIQQGFIPEADVDRSYKDGETTTQQGENNG